MLCFVTCGDLLTDMHYTEQLCANHSRFTLCQLL